jgi:hypothetical protein
MTHPVHYPQHIGYPRAGVAGAYPYGTGRYLLGARAAMPSTAVTVSLHFHFSSLIALARTCLCHTAALPLAAKLS